ncbi:hypothetical protein GPECTOR_123g474 [Gonium pectorale]|uniref:Uncharacterized protein n=1 Tax=Gonium pectorale TaxID=33097 RepID=A0A150FYL5_GONPE|nr:hypothetical protein GPECTOR_123g474 [Gonium pectorale]|eukprot:KXZ42702.1 hypothetical protein GPECTOR_123g474 [Gonium pectorale]
MAHGLDEGAAAKQASAAGELDQWLLSTGVPRTLQTCTADDVLCYMAGYYTDTEEKGATREQLKAKGQIASESVIDRYLDRTGHQTGRNTRRRT